MGGWWLLYWIVQSLDGDPLRPETMSAWLSSEFIPTSEPLHMLFLLPGTWNNPLPPDHPPPTTNWLLLICQVSTKMSFSLTTLSKVSPPKGILYFSTLFIFFTALTTNCIYFICLFTDIYSLPTQECEFHGAGSTSVLISTKHCVPGTLAQFGHIVGTQ